MITKTIALAGSEAKAEFSGANAWLRNDGMDVIYAAAKPGITAGADGVVAIPAGQSAPVYGANGAVWLLGTGSVQLIGSDYSTNPFKTSAQAGGSGADEVARAAINEHSRNAGIHVPSGGTSGQILGIGADGSAAWGTHSGIDVGQNTAGKTYTVDDVEYTGHSTCEIFNASNNIAADSYSHAEGFKTKALKRYSHAEGYDTTASVICSHAEGRITTASGDYSHAEGYSTTASGRFSHAEGYNTIASNYASHAGGKYSKAMTAGASSSINAGDAFVIGNGTSADALSNAFRVTYEGAVYGLSAFNSSGADYAEFIKPWADGNPDSEDRVGYMVTVKDGLLYKANEGDYIVGITSGNPSIVGNADEDYYWRYERDEFNRFVYEDAEEEVEQLDENGMPVMVKTGNIIKNAHYKLSESYDPTKQNDYIERKNRPEWSYVGMIGVIPVRDDGTCVAGGFAKCGADGVATKAEGRGFDTFYVIERISDGVVSVEMR